MQINKTFKVNNPLTAQENLFYAFVNMDRTSQEYERVVYTFIDMFGFLGGLFDFLFFCGLIWTQFFTENMYFHNVLSRLYQLRIKQENIQHKQTVPTKTCDEIFNSNKILKEESSKNSNSSEIQSEVCISKYNDFASMNKNEIKSNYRW